MKKYYFAIIFCVVCLLAVSAAFVIGYKKTGEMPTAQEENPFLAPKGSVQTVIKNFYDGYLSYPGNVLADQSFLGSPLLSNSYKQKISSIITASVGGAYDPVLCAQDKPQTYEIKDVVENGDVARATLSANYGETVNTLTVALVKEAGDSWMISDVTCSGDPQRGTKLAVIYYSNSRRAAGENDCGLVYGVERSLANASDPTEVLHSLFSGPTKEEAANGYNSLFSERTKGILRGVNVKNKIAYVDLEDITKIIPNASASCGSREFMSEVTETLKHNLGISEVRFAINANPETFYDFVQIGCSGDLCDKTNFKK